MKVFHIAVIGCGMISKSHFKAIEQLSNEEVSAVAEARPDCAEQVGRQLGCLWYTDTEEMLRKELQADVCLICLPAYLHAEHIALRTSYGKAVLCEEPFTITVEQAQAVVDAAARWKVPCMTAQVVRFWTSYREIRQMPDAGELGEICMAYFSRCAERQVWDNAWLYGPKNGSAPQVVAIDHRLEVMRTVNAIQASAGTGAIVKIRR